MLGAPVLPDPVPGAAVSPGTNNWSLANDPALMMNELLVAPLKPVPIPEAEAVIVLLPAWLMTKLLNVAFPLTSVLSVVVPLAKQPGFKTTVSVVLFDEL